MPKYPLNLQHQLRKYDEIVSLERRRIIEGYKKYGSSYMKEDLTQEMIHELLDLFGYLILMRMKGERNER